MFWLRVNDSNLNENTERLHGCVYQTLTVIYLFKCFNSIDDIYERFPFPFQFQLRSFHGDAMIQNEIK